MPLYYLTKEFLMSHSLDALFKLMIEKIEEIKILRTADADIDAFKQVDEELTLIHKVSSIKKSNVPINEMILIKANEVCRE